MMGSRSFGMIIILLVLVCSAVFTPGCTRSAAGEAPVLTTTVPGEENTNQTCTSDVCTEPAGTPQGFVARPSLLADKPVLTQPAIVEPGGTKWAGPPLAGKGSTEVNITEIVLAVESIERE